VQTATNFEDYCSPIYVFGNSLASMVAVFELTKEKKNFLWIQDGSNVEGIWRGLSYKDRILDLGMINFELDVRHPAPPGDLGTYSQYEINDCARFSSYVMEFINHYTEVKELPKIKIFENSGVYSDHLISNDFSDLERFRNFFSEEIEETADIHPSKKYTALGKEKLLDVSYDRYVERFFGQKLSDLLFLSWAAKLVGENVSCTNTFRHRAAWLPLPYPETIFDALSGELKKDYSYRFHYPTEETFSEFVNRIYFDLNSNQDIQKIDLSDISDLALNDIINSDSKIFWGAKLEAFLGVMKSYPTYEIKGSRNLINVDIYEVQLESDFESYVFLNNDPVDHSWYRLTVLPNVVLEDGLRVAVVESRNSMFDSQDAQPFLNLGVNLKSQVKSLRGVPVFLTLEGTRYREYEFWHKSLANDFPNLNFGGGTSFAYSATFSDQVVQGIKFVRKECRDVR
jgi:hypothetical protein